MKRSKSVATAKTQSSQRILKMGCAISAESSRCVIDNSHSTGRNSVGGFEIADTLLFPIFRS